MEFVDLVPGNYQWPWNSYPRIISRLECTPVSTVEPDTYTPQRITLYKLINIDHRYNILVKRIGQHVRASKKRKIANGGFNHKNRSAMDCNDAAASGGTDQYSLESLIYSDESFRGISYCIVVDDTHGEDWRRVCPRISSSLQFFMVHSWGLYKE